MCVPFNQRPPTLSIFSFSETTYLALTEYPFTELVQLKRKYSQKEKENLASVFQFKNLIHIMYIYIFFAFNKSNQCLKLQKSFLEYLVKKS